MRASVALSRLLRAGSVLVLGLALVSVLGGGSCSFCTGSYCDDDDDCWDDDDTNDKGCNGSAEEAQAGADWSPGEAEVSRQLGELSRRWPGVELRLAGAGEPAASRPGPPWLLERPGLHGAEPAFADLASWRLTDADVEHGDDPFRHPVARVRVRNFSVLERWGRPTISADDFTVMAGLVLRANDALLGLPPWAGRLRPTRAQFLDTIVAVVFEQVPPSQPDDGEPLPGARLTVVFDHLGRLVQIENETVAPPGTRLPTPSAWALR
jgi:hypothetical protein